MAAYSKRAHENYFKQHRYKNEDAGRQAEALPRCHLASVLLKGVWLMDRYQLQHLSDESLERLRKDLSGELSRRGKEKAKWTRYKKSKDTFIEQHPPPELWVEQNSAGIYAIPHINKMAPNTRTAYLIPLLRQNWKPAFSGLFDLEPKYYVYAHVDPSKKRFPAHKEAGGIYPGRPFYIGKGCGNRAYDLKRNQGHGKILRRVLQADYSSDQIVHIVRDGLSEIEALELESKLVYFFGIIYDTLSGRKPSGWLVNLDIPTRPFFEREMIKKPPVSFKSNPVSGLGEGVLI